MFECKVLILSTSVFDSTPIIYEYTKHPNGMITYIESANDTIYVGNVIIKINITQILTSLQMSKFIEINALDADLIVIYENNSVKLPSQILDLINNKPTLIIKMVPSKTFITNKIKELYKSELLKVVVEHIIEPVNNSIESNNVFGNTTNPILVYIDLCLDRVVSCCTCSCLKF
jgi:hypothetical protein